LCGDDAANALDDATRRSAMNTRHLHRSLLQMLNIGRARHGLTGDMHRTAANDGAAASAGAKFCKSHLYRHIRVHFVEGPARSEESCPCRTPMPDDCGLVPATATRLTHF